MSNKPNTNPMDLDTVGDVFKTGTMWHFQGINIVPSAGSWVVVLADGAGNTIYNDGRTSADKVVESFPPIMIDGLRVITLTNITRILVHKQVS
jgi:hypothetical protein